MIIKNIVQIGNPIMNKRATFVKAIDSPDIQRSIQSMIDSMRYHELVGLAASQIGIKHRIFVTEVRKTKYRNPQEVDALRVYINPHITWFSREQSVVYEGCGSVAYGKLFAPVKRPKKITVEAFDETGERFRLKADGLLSRVIQHEYDHLAGIEFTEKITDIKKIMSSEEYVKRVSLKNNKK